MSLYASPLLPVEGMMVPVKWMGFGDDVHDEFKNQQYTLELFNVTYEDNGTYRVEVTYAEGDRDVTVVIGRIKLYVYGKFLNLFGLSFKFGVFLYLFL